MSIDSVKLLSPIGAKLRSELVKRYSELSKRYSLRQWEPAELNAGKFCEAAYCTLKAALESDFSAVLAKPKNFKKACEDLEKYPAGTLAVGDRSIRILIPRVLIPLYEVRNNRGVGHIGSDVDPNQMDASMVMHLSSWVLSELVRIFHGVSVLEAQKSVSQLTELEHPIIWTASNGQKRVLDPSLKTPDKVLAVTYGEARPLNVETVRAWVGHSHSTRFKAILKDMHKEALLEWDVSKRTIEISPKGVSHVEQSGMLQN